MTAVAGTADVRITDHSTDPLRPVVGETFAGQSVTVSNLGPDPATNVTITLDLPPNLSMSPTQTGIQCTGTTCTIGTLSVNAQVLVLVRMVADAPGSGTVTYTVSADQDDPNLTNNAVTRTVHVLGTALAMTGSAPTTALLKNTPIELTYVIRNAGPGLAENVAFDQVLTGTDPSFNTVVLEYVSASASQGSCTQSEVQLPRPGGGTFPAPAVNCALGTLAVDGEATVVVTVQTDRSVRLTNVSAAASADQARGASSTLVLDIGLVDLTVTQTISATPLIGETFTVTMSGVNNGPDVAANARLRTEFTGSLIEFVSATGAAGDCSPGSNTVTCPLGDLAADESYSVTATFRPVSPTTSTSIRTTIASDDRDAVTQDNTHTLFFRIDGPPGSDIRITDNMTSSMQPVVGETFAGNSVTVRNLGPDPATNVTITLDLPPNLSMSPTQTGIECTGTTCTIGNLSVNAQVLVLVRMVADAPGSGTVTYTVSADQDDPNLANNAVTRTVHVLGTALTMTGSAPTTALLKNTPIELTYVIRNAGPGLAENVAFDQVLTGTDQSFNTVVLDYVSASASQGSCTQSEPAVDCALGTLAVDGEATVVVTVQTHRSVKVSNVKATASADQARGANSFLDLDIGLVDLTVTQTISATPLIGQTFTVTINGVNKGPDVAANARLRTEFTGSLIEFVSATGAAGDCSPGSNTVSCPLGDLAADESYSVTATFRPLSPTTSTSIRATITSDDRDAATQDNSHTLFFRINAVCQTIPLAPATLPIANLGSSYSETLTASGGSAPYTFSISAAPPGLSLSAAGELAGTATTAGSFAFTVTATDVNSCSGTRDYVLTVSSPPVVSVGGPYTVAEGDQLSLVGSASHPDGDDLSISWKVTPAAPLLPNGASATFDATDLNGPDEFNVELQACAGDVCVTDATTIVVLNVAPAVGPVAGPQNARVRRTLTVSALFTDPGAGETHTAQIDWGDGTITTATVVQGNRGGTVSGSHSYNAAGDYTIVINVTDDDGDTGSAQYGLFVDENYAPIVTSIVLPAEPVPTGTLVTATAFFTDANPDDTHTAAFNWGSASTAAVVDQAAGSATGSFTFSQPGVYPVEVTVSDDELSGSRTSTLDTPAYIVVYDPSAGFVTGGGWITSPEGTCQLAVDCAGSSGMATFGFTARYVRGANAPVGVTQFHFRAGNLRFQSDVYNWLVVAGARAQFKGSGRINGGGDYEFMLTGIDGDLPGGGGVDRFRIKIWERSTGTIVYDNESGKDDTADPASVLGGGNIVIRR